ncbi:MAG: 1-acyl-sn-glycerol-3-phosphate acyltransferase [Lachnospiraceae bacterium]|nr:1-acyl-sn-glycerol-3-phosphate acyltransferase [Lachnospiraceae bacterium]
MQIVYEFLRCFGLIQGWPAHVVLFKKKVYYEDVNEKNRFIKGGALIISNHFAVFDYMVNVFLFPFRKLHVVVAEFIYKRSKFYHFGLRCFGGIRSDRDIKGMRFIDESVKVLKKGGLVQIFPEAQTSDGRGLQYFKPSYIMIALRAGVPIIPVVLDGNYGITKRTHVLIGKKIYVREFCSSENPTKEEIENLNKMVFDKFCQLKTQMEENIEMEKKVKNNG